MNSIRSKLFMQIGLLIFIMIGLLWIANQLFLSPYYISKVKNQLIDDYDTINQLFEYDSDSSLEILSSLESDTQMDLLIIDRASTLLYQTSGSDYNRRFIDQMNNTTPNSPMPAPPNTMDGITFDGGIRLPNPIGDISKIEDIDGNLRYLWLDDPLFSGRNLILTGLLDNNAIVFLRVPLATIETGIATSNQFLLFIGGGIFILGMIMAYMMAKSFTKPITTISRITKNMKQLDFNEYCPVTSNDELGKLAENINELSLALSGNIEQLNHEIHEKNLVNEKRKELLNNVSHELKTPLALMQGYAEGLKLNVANSSDKKDFYCDVIIDETKKMNGLVHQLLNINQLEFGHNVLQKTTFDLSDLMTYFLKKYQPLCDEKSISLNFLIIDFMTIIDFTTTNEIKDANLDKIMVQGDTYKVEQMLTNYMMNAINYTEAPYILRIELDSNLADTTIDYNNFPKTSSNYHKRHVRITFVNSAAFIPDEQLVQLFDSFYKLDESRTREIGGHGLGLSIVKAIQDADDNHYGVYNTQDGIAFYFDVDKA